MELSRLRIEFATEAFLSRMRSALAKRHPAAPIQGKNLSAYSSSDAADLMAAVKTAIVAGSEKADEAFNKWVDENKNAAGH